MKLKTPTTNEDIKQFINSGRFYKKPVQILNGTIKAYKNLGLDEHDSSDYLYTIVISYQKMIILNRDQILRDNKAYLEFMKFKEFIKKHDEVVDIEYSKIALHMLKNVIEICELRRGLLAQLFPRWS